MIELRKTLLKFFASVYRLDRRVRRRLAPPGYVVLAAMCASVVGLNTRLSLASQIFSFLLIVLVLASLSSLSFRPSLKVRRSLPPFVSAGETARYTLFVDNEGRKSHRGLRVLDQLRETMPSVTDYARWRDTADRHRNRFDRWVGYPRWLALVHRLRGADIEAVEVPDLAAGESVRVEISFTPKRRGYLRFSGCHISRPDHLGVWNALHWSRAADSLLVLPRRYPVRKLDLPGGRLYQPGGVTLAAVSGDSEEFVSLREYRAGDSLRGIHWRSWARVGKPIVKEYRPEYFSRHALVLDTFAQPEQDAQFEEAVSVAASFLNAIDTHDALLDLLFVADEAYRFTGGRGLNSTTELMKVLACVEPGYGQSFSVLQESVMQNASQFSGCVLVLLAWDAPRQRLVDQLRAQSIEPVVLVVADDEQMPSTVGTGVTVLQPGSIAQKLATI